jgi:phosphoglycolate phosphatase-like HAD superfamily hydrolase
VRCALDNGVTAVGVGSGRYRAAELLQAGAHIAFEDLSDVELVVDSLMKLS